MAKYVTKVQCPTLNYNPKCTLVEMDRGPFGRRLATKKLLFRLISFIGEATWPSIMQNG